MVYLELRVGGRLDRRPLQRGEQVLGRDPGCDLVVDDASVSRRHAQLQIVDDRVSLLDLDSTNGLWNDGHRVERFETEFDHWFVLGSVLARVRRGVALRSESRTSRRPARRRPQRTAETPSTTAPLSPRESNRATAQASWVERLSLALTRPTSSGTLATLLEMMSELGSSEQALLLRRVDGHWCIEASMSERSLPQDAIEALDRVLEFPATFNLGNSPAYAEQLDEGVVFLAWPWRVEERSTDPRISVLVGLMRCWVGLQARRSPEPPRATATRPATRETDTSGFISVAPICKQMLRDVDSLARTDLSILIRGESGTGKELIAQRIHDRSPRQDAPYLAINCAALPADLLEAELFGIESGVATGVTGRRGKFALAHGGTLFLDEIGDLSLHLQPKLLRVIESRTVTPIGSQKQQPADVRIVAASHLDLRSKIGSGEFREDLWYRLTGSTVEIPPLRDRPEDIMPLARHFARSAAGNRRSFRGFEVSAAQLLLGHRWPGNVRELRHVISRAVALCDGPVLPADLLPAELREHADRGWGDVLVGLEDDWRAARARFDRLYFEQLIERCRGNLARASREAGLSRSNLYRKLEELEIERPRKRR